MAKNKTALKAATQETEQPQEKKLTPMEARRRLLQARITGPNVSNYPAETMKAWKREKMLIDKGLWERPMRIKSKNKTVEEIIG